MTDDLHAEATRLCATGCGCSEEQAEMCAFLDGHCRKQERAILSALRAAEARVWRAAAKIAEAQSEPEDANVLPMGMRNAERATAKSIASVLRRRAERIEEG